MRREWRQRKREDREGLRTEKEKTREGRRGEEGRRRKEGREEERGEEAGQELMERERRRGKGKGEKGVRESKGDQREKSGRESQEGPNSPFYSKPVLPSCCQVTVGSSVEGVPTE